MSIQDELIESAFQDEYDRMKHEGLDAILAKRLDVMLYQVYRRGYIRGHSQRSKEVSQEKEIERRSGIYPMGVEIRHEGDKLILDGKAVHVE